MNANHPLRRARWIWPSYGPDVVGGAHHPHNVYAQFRCGFSLRSIPQRAPFYITADQCYMLYVNGRYVSRGPARGYQHHWPFDQLDLTPYLRRGHNWISVRAYNAGVSTYQYVHQSAAGLLCAGQWKGAQVLSGPGSCASRPPIAGIPHRSAGKPTSRSTLTPAWTISRGYDRPDGLPVGTCPIAVAPSAPCPGPTSSLAAYPISLATC